MALQFLYLQIIRDYCTPNSKVHGANMGPIWDLLALDGPYVGPMNLAFRDGANLPNFFHSVFLSDV